MASLQEALQYASKNPNSEFTRFLTQRIKSGQADEEAQSLGIDLTPIKQYQEPTQTEVSKTEPQGDKGVAGFATGVFKGTANIARDLLGLGQRAGQKILSAITPGKTYEDIKQETGFDILSDETQSGQKLKEKLTPTGTSEKIGSFVPEVASLAIPATKISKATKALSFIPRTTARVVGDVGVSQLTTGGKDDATTTGVTSAVFESVSPALKLLGRIAKGTAGVLSGTGSDVIEQTLKTPRAVKTAIKIPPLESIKEDTSNVLSQVRKLITDSSANYGKSLEDLPKRLGRNPQVITAGQKTTIKVGDKTYTLSMQGVKSNLTETLRKYGVEVSPKKGSLDFLGTTLDSTEESRLREVFDVVNSWKDTTPKGLNTLATKISNYKKADTQSKQLNSIIGNISGNVREYIGKRVPAVKELNDRFAKEQRFIEELDAYLSTDLGFDNPQNAKMVAQKIQTLFTKNKDIARDVLENLAGGSDVLARQAGRELAGGVSRSTATIGDKLSGLIQAVISPQVVGNLVANTGIALDKIQPFVDVLQKYSPQERALLIQAVQNMTE